MKSWVEGKHHHSLICLSILSFLFLPSALVILSAECFVLVFSSNNIDHHFRKNNSRFVFLLNLRVLHISSQLSIIVKFGVMLFFTNGDRHTCTLILHGLTHDMPTPQLWVAVIFTTCKGCSSGRAHHLYPRDTPGLLPHLLPLQVGYFVKAQILECWKYFLVGYLHIWKPPTGMTQHLIASPMPFWVFR